MALWCNSGRYMIFSQDCEPHCTTKNDKM